MIPRFRAWGSSCLQARRDSCRGDSCFGKHVARRTASQLLPEQCGLAGWGPGARAGGLQAMGRLRGLKDFASSPPGFPPGSLLKTRWVSRGLERRWGLFPGEYLGSRRNQEGSELPASGAGFLPWFCFPFHKYEHQRAGEEIFWSRQQNEENISLNPTLPQPPACPPQKRKKFCIQREEGEKVLFSFTMKKSQQDVLPKLQIYFPNSKYLY